MSVLAQQQQQQQQYAAHPQQQNVVPQQPLFAAIKDNSGNQIMVSFQLEVAQQPDRARMCGFGDKDRRPITPPPCVRLVIVEQHSGQEINYEDFDSQSFVLSVDIWSQDGSQPQNEVKHSNTSPSVSISMASLTSYPPPPEHSMSPYMPQNMQGQYGQYGANRMGASYGYSAQPYYGPTGSFQRNLIGSLSVSASYLQDTQDKYGYWFVLQDLSVRTEGTFRLRLTFMNLSIPMPGPPAQQFINGNGTPARVPILASAFTDAFQVFSAKKFPGVKESTELSKKFANQGVKIPIRKDGGGPGSRKRGSDEGSDEG